MFYRLEKKGGGETNSSTPTRAHWVKSSEQCAPCLKESDNGSLSVQRKVFAILLWEAEKSARKIIGL